MFVILNELSLTNNVANSCIRQYGILYNNELSNTNFHASLSSDNLLIEEICLKSNCSKLDSVEMNS